MDVINKQEETREKFDHLAYKRRYYHEHEEFRKDKNKKIENVLHLDIGIIQNLEKKVLIERYSFIIIKS